MPPTILGVVKNGLGLRQPEPPEGRKAFPLDVVDFTADGQEFDFNSTAKMGPTQPSGILSMWVDASALTAAKNVYLQTSLQTFTIAGGTQGYIILTSQMPFNLKITADAGLRGNLNIILYNYNVFNTGTTVTAPVQVPGGGSGNSGGGTGASGNPFTGVGCVEEGTPVIEPEGSTQEVVGNSEWVSITFEGCEPVVMHPDTLVVVYKQAVDLAPNDLISVGKEGAMRADWVKSPVFIKDGFKVIRRCPGGRYLAGSAQVELHNIKIITP